MHLSFEESVFGGEQAIQFSFFETCGKCDGTGAKSNSCIKLCANCHGRGGVVKTQKTPFGMMSQVVFFLPYFGKGNLIFIQLMKWDKVSKYIKIIQQVIYSKNQKILGQGMLNLLYILLPIDAREGNEKLICDCNTSTFYNLTWTGYVL